MGYVDEVLELVSKKNADQSEFLHFSIFNTLFIYFFLVICYSIFVTLSF